MAGAGATVKKRRLDEFMNDRLSVHLACHHWKLSATP